MAMIGKVRRMHHREKKSVREIARATSLSRNTVTQVAARRRWRRRPKYRRERGATKLTPFARDAEAGAEGRCASTEAGAAHGAGAVRSRSRRPATRAATPG